MTKCSALVRSFSINTKNQITNPGFQYDAAGNLTNDGSHGYQYDAESRLLSVDGGATASYVYDGDGQRVVKTAGGETRVYLRSPVLGKVLNEYVDGAWKNEYRYVNGQLLQDAEMQDTGSVEVQYYFHDHLGTPRVLAYADGTVAARHDYYPFGGEHTIWSDGKHYKFTGQERDPETGLDYFIARHYASNLGRFLQADPKRSSARRIQPQSWNRYSYTLNNPLKFVDPNGLDVVLASNLSRKDRAFVVRHLARLHATRAGRAFLQRADKSKFTIEAGTAKLGRRVLTKAPPGTVVYPEKVLVKAGVTRYGFATNGHTVLVAHSPDSPTGPPIQVLIDPAQAAEIGKDPAVAFGHEFGGHLTDLLNAAESNASQIIDGFNPKDETTSIAAEEAVRADLPKKLSQKDVEAVEELIKPKKKKDEEE